MLRLVRYDNAVKQWADRQARRVPGLLRPFGVVLAGSFLIWAGPKMIEVAAGVRHWLACLVPWLGLPLGLACADGPTILGWVVSLLLLAAGVWIGTRVFGAFSSVIIGSSARLVDPQDRPCRVLIMGLSPLANESTKVAIAEAAEWTDRWRLYAGPAAPWRAALQSVGEDDRAKAGPWQQAARMVAEHLASGRLERIYVLPSWESREQVEPFKKYLDKLFGRKLDVRSVAADGIPFRDPEAESERQGQSYDNYRYLRTGLIHAVEIAQREMHEDFGSALTDNDICIDATAGFKMFSIAAAVVTLDRNILLGYVVSGGPPGANPEEGVVKIYDARIDLASALADKFKASF